MAVKPPNPKYIAKPYEKMQDPCQRVQIDVKFVPEACIVGEATGKKFYQYTAIDEYSRFRYLEAFEEHSTYSSAVFLEHMLERFPFKVEMMSRFRTEKQQEQIAEKVNKGQIDLLIGGSVGGFQAIEWSISRRDIIKNVALLACNARITPWGNAFNESQRMALFADPTLEQQDFSIKKGEIVARGGAKGLAAARSIALISYRSYQGYNKSQYETSNEIIWNHKAASYQQYQGQKLVKRFDAYSYLSMINLTDSHNIGRGRGGVDTALNMINANVVCVGIDSDILFPTEEQKYIASHVRKGSYREITSLYGHDGFLLEWKQIETILKEIL